MAPSCTYNLERLQPSWYLLLRLPLNFADRPHLLAADVITYGFTNIVLAPYGDYWRQLRKISTQELLSAKRVKSFQSIREEEVSNLVQYISMNTGSYVNLSDKILSVTYGITARAVLGEKCKDQEAYVSFIKELMTTAEALGVTNLFPSQKWLHVISGVMPKLKKMHRAGDTVLENIIRAATTKTNDGNGCLLSVFLNLKDHSSPEFHLTINTIKAIIQDMSSATLEWVFSELLKNPRVLRNLQNYN